MRTRIRWGNIIIIGHRTLGAVQQQVAAVVVLLLVVLAVCAERGYGAIPEHLVTNLPGQPVVSFRQYAGYIPVDASGSKQLFYWFVEADHKDAASLPIAFWFNGGPGCSSIGDGLLSELGPFRVTASEDLILNEHSWNKAANVIFVDSPVGVGFSYSTVASDYSNFTDSQIALDAYHFLVNWYKSYSEYNNNELYIIGESYGGHYLPNLVQQVVNHNKDPGAYQLKNLKGFQVGNAWTDPYWDNKGSVEWFHSHSLISDQTYITVIENCNFTDEFQVDYPVTNAECNDASYDLYYQLGGLDIYNVYVPSCNVPYNSSVRSLMKSKIHLFPAAAAIDPCADFVTPYLNNPAVKAALHVLPDIQWTECSGLVLQNYFFPDIVRSMIPVYQKLLEADLRIWVYSGDFDGRVPTTGTREWINTLDLPIVKAWYPWTQPTPTNTTALYDPQVDGYTQVYGKNFTFASVRASGHLVPQDQPARALTLFEGFLSGKPLVEFVPVGF
ncbi:unnamed protein product [Sphagnum jensenii]|uniref:Carboxypeptidase n=1 Tax=Sphagnum jensenii TaxID=128206 RepID=A0ABP0X3A4_9BRYO